MIRFYSINIRKIMIQYELILYDVEPFFLMPYNGEYVQSRRLWASDLSNRYKVEARYCR